MKKLTIALAALASTTLASPALAAVPTGVEGTVSIEGSVAERCLFTIDSESITLGEMAQGSSGTNPGRLDASVIDTQSKTLAGWCNGTAATISVEAEAIENDDYLTAPPSGFARVVNYTATANANGEDATDSSTTAGAGTPVTVGIFTGDVVVTLSNASAGTDLLVAGDYSGQVIVTLSPSN